MQSTIGITSWWGEKMETNIRRVCVLANMALWDQRTFLTNRRRKLSWSKDILADPHNFIVKFWGEGLSLTYWVRLYKRTEKRLEVNMIRHKDSFANVCVRVWVCMYECVIEWVSEWMSEWVWVSDWVYVCGDCPDGQGAYMDKVITETRVSKLGGLISETWHFQVALIQGYHINLTLLSEGPPGRKWVEGHDLESTSQTSPAMAHREPQGKLHSRSLDVPDGLKIWVDGWRKSLKTTFYPSLDI